MSEGPPKTAEELLEVYKIRCAFLEEQLADLKESLYKDFFLYRYRATLVRVVDGDTVRLRVDLGFNIAFEENFRLADIDTPEVRGPEREDGLKAKAFVEEFFQNCPDAKVMICSIKHGKYRWVLEIWNGDECLNIALLEAGHAREYL